MGGPSVNHKFINHKPCYQILHDSPACRDNYISTTKSTKFPLAFCNMSWFENKPITYRLLEI